MPQSTITDGSPEKQKQKIVVSHNAADDQGGADHVADEFYESHEGGKYLMPAILERVDETRFEIKELDIIKMDLSDGPGNYPNAKYLHTIEEHAPKGIRRVYKAFKAGHKVLSLGGNHVRALDIIGAMQACHELGIPFGLIWIDQHLDFNTPDTTETDNIHGMVSAILQGRGAKELLALLEECPFVDSGNIVYIGPREDMMDGYKTKKVDVDGNVHYAEGTEAYCFQKIKEKGVRCFTAQEINTNSRKVIPPKAKEAIKEINDRVKGVGGRMWCDLDADVVETQYMPASVMGNEESFDESGTETGRGLTKDHMNDLFDFIEKYCDIDGMGVSEICPDKDKNKEGKTYKEFIEAGKLDKNFEGISRDLIAECASKALGVGKKEVIQLASKESKIWRRILDFVAGTATGIAALIVSNQLMKPDTLSQQKSGEQITSASGEQYLNERRDMMYKFMKQDVRRQVKVYKLAQEGPQEYKEYVELLRKVWDAEALAPGKGDRSDVIRYLLSELCDVLGHQKGKEVFQRIIAQV